MNAKTIGKEFKMLMRKEIVIVIAVLIVMVLHVANANFDEGLVAYEARDYATALKEFRPLGSVEIDISKTGFLFLKNELERK